MKMITQTDKYQPYPINNYENYEENNHSHADAGGYDGLERL